MIILSSKIALLGSFDSFSATSKACIGMVWPLLRVHEVLSTTWPYLHYLAELIFQKHACYFGAVFNAVFANPDIHIYPYAAVVVVVASLLLLDSIEQHTC